MITEYLSNLLVDLYVYFNKALFPKKLKDCHFITKLQTGVMGSFIPESWTNSKNELIHQIILNPYIFKQEPRVLHSAIIHNMLHVYQYDFPERPRLGYHDKVFAQIAEDRGFPTSSTGEPGGKKTGQKMLHYFSPGGLAIKASDDRVKNLIKYWPLDLDSIFNSRKNKADYLCSNCNLKLYGQPNHKVICGDCYKKENRIIYMDEIAPKRIINPWIKN